MSKWSSGRRMRELGLGESVVFPSDSSDRDFVLHGNQTLESVSRLLGRQATPEDLRVAQANAKTNQPFDQLVRESIGYGAAGEREKQAQQNQMRFAGTALAGSGGAAGLIALIDYLQSSKIEKSERD